jgi:hypothetical protein
VSHERLDRRDRVGQRPDVLFRPRRQRLRSPDPEANRGDVHVIVVPREAEVHVHDLAVRNSLAGLVHVRGDPERAREVVGRTEGQEA